MAASHPADEMGGEAFAGGGDGTFLAGEGGLVGPRNQSLIVDFGRLVLWPCIKFTISRHKTIVVSTCLCSTFLVRDEDAEAYPCGCSQNL